MLSELNCCQNTLYNNLCIRFGTQRVQHLNQAVPKLLQIEIVEIPGWARQDEWLSHSKLK